MHVGDRPRQPYVHTKKTSHARTTHNSTRHTHTQHQTTHHDVYYHPFHGGGYTTIWSWSKTRFTDQLSTLPKHPLSHPNNTKHSANTLPHPLTSSLPLSDALECVVPLVGEDATMRLFLSFLLFCTFSGLPRHPPPHQPHPQSYLTHLPTFLLNLFPLFSPPCFI